MLRNDIFETFYGVFLRNVKVFMSFDKNLLKIVLVLRKLLVCVKKAVIFKVKPRLAQGKSIFLIEI